MIQLTKDLWVKADECCYIVGKPRRRAGKGVVFDNPTYYTTMDQAVQGALKRAMRLGVKDDEIKVVCILPQTECGETADLPPPPPLPNTQCVIDLLYPICGQ